MRGIEVRQPSSITALGLFQAIFWTAALLLLCLYAWNEDGGLTSDYVFPLGIIGAMSFIGWGQLLSRLHKVVVNNDGIRAIYYGGRTRWLSWQDISQVQLLDAQPGKGAKKLIDLKPNKGPKLRIDDRMSNFEEAAGIITICAPPHR